MTTLQVGNVEITAIRDAAWRYSPATFITLAPADEWRKQIEADPQDEVESRVLCFLVKSDEGLMLVDSGVGQWGLWQFGDGVLLETLSSEGIDPDDIALVIPTHMHGDHVGGCMRPTSSGPVPNFPRARYVFQRGDWDYFTGAEFLDGPPTATRSTIKQGILPLADTGLVDLVDPGHRFSPSVDLIALPGHTPGSCAVRVQSEGSTALMFGDTAHHQAQIANPEWSSIADVDAEGAAEARRIISEEAVRSNAMVASAHFLADSPIFAPIVDTGRGYRWNG
jgi:glyoxylase-like metal-dependent hydrolase (beta-lactamase superfamily II)